MHGSVMNACARLCLTRPCRLPLQPQADWLSRVVVDTLDFKIGRMLVKDKPWPVERATDILRGPAKKLALRKVRRARLPSGKVRSALWCTCCGVQEGVATCGHTS